MESRKKILTRLNFSTKPKVDKALYALATIQADYTASTGSIQFSDEVVDALWQAYIEVEPTLHEGLGLEEYLISHCIRCFLELPSKALVLRALLLNEHLNGLAKTKFSDEIQVLLVKMIQEAVVHSDSIFLVQRSMWILSLFSHSVESEALHRIRNMAQCSEEPLSRSAYMLLLMYPSLPARDEITSHAAKISWPNSIYTPCVSQEANESFGARSLYLSTSAGDGPHQNTDVLQLALKDQNIGIANDTIVESDVAQPTKDSLMTTGAYYFCLFDGLQELARDSVESSPELAVLVTPLNILKRFSYVRHVVWANQLDVKQCALAFLSIDDALFLSLENTTVSAERRAFTTMLNVYCLLEDYFSLPGPILAEEGHYGASKVAPKTALFFTMRLLSHVIVCPRNLDGDIAGMTLLSLWTHMFSRIHVLDIEVVDRLRALIVEVLRNQHFAFPWDQWHAIANATVDSRFLVCRKLFLFELLRDLAEGSFPGRIRGVIPQELHGFVLKKRPPNEALIKENVFRLSIQSIDCESVRTLQKTKPEGFKSFSCELQLLDSILGATKVSHAYQKQLLERFKPIFDENLAICTDASKGGYETTSVALLDHVYKFWTTSHSDRLQTMFHLLETGVISPSAVPTWLESKCIEGVWEQSWIRQVTIHAFRITLQRWKSTADDSTENSTAELATGEIQSFFFNLFSALQRKITSLADKEDDEVQAFVQAADLRSQPMPHWNGRNVLLFQSAIGLLRWFARMYFTLRIPHKWPEHEKKIREIVFVPGPCHDSIARLWRHATIASGCHTESFTIAEIDKELQRLRGGRHTAYRRYSARKAAQSAAT